MNQLWFIHFMMFKCSTHGPILQFHYPTVLTGGLVSRAHFYNLCTSDCRSTFDHSTLYIRPHTQAGFTVPNTMASTFFSLTPRFRISFTCHLHTVNAVYDYINPPAFLLDSNLSDGWK